MAKKRKLSVKQKLFCKEYLVDLNGTRAYKAAYATDKDSTARTNASKLLANPNIQAVIQRAKDKLAKKLEISTERVLKEYARLSFYNPKDFFDENGDLIPIHELSDDAAAAIQGIDIVVNKNSAGKQVSVTKKIKLVTKHQPLESLSKHLGLFKEGGGDKDKPLPIKVVIEREDGRKNGGSE